MKFIDSVCACWRAIRNAGALGLVLGIFLTARGAESPKNLISDSYRVQPTDILIIEVVNEPQLSAKEFRVSSSGEVSFPFIGAVKAAGRTTVEIQTELKAMLEADYLVNAQVLVQVKEFRKQQISVFGQVNRPGLIDIPPERRLTVIEAITSAGGFTRLARTSDIQLTRSGRAEPMRFSVEDLRNPEKTVYVEPGDVIFVPESRI
ncbi:MAG: polysaccharide export protein [Verrucomicrobiales bacterium]|nr:polysaccharide export protein [Verrucomicrobiales bacterium]